MPNKPSGETAPRNAQAIYQAIAGKVRADSKDPARLTRVEELGPLFPEMTPEEVINYLTELYEIEEYSDVRATISPSGAASLYSTTCFSPEQAAERCMKEEVHARIAAKVREDSKAQARLTPIESLSELFPELSAERIAEYVANLSSQPDDADLRLLTGPTGTRYLFSVESVTPAYATMLARADAHDPCMMIAETVREESRTYPRPTKVPLFYEPVFQISDGQIEEIVEKVLSQPDCADIKRIVASTGAVYLYSERYMPAGQAERWVEWEEVEQYKNP